MKVYKTDNNVTKNPKSIYKRSNGSLKPSFWVVLALIIFWTSGTVLSLVLTVKDCNTPTARADTLSNFSTVPVDFVVTATVSPSSASSRQPIDVNIVNTSYVFSFPINSDGTLVVVPYRGVFIPSTTTVTFSSMNGTFTTSVSSWSVPLTSNTNPNLPDVLNVTEYKYFDNSTGNYEYEWDTTYFYYHKLTGVYPVSTTASLGILCSETPINFLKLYKVNFLLEQSSESRVQRTVTYYDIDGNYVLMRSVYIDTQPTFYNYDRYIQSTLDNNAEYQSGYNAGYIAGESSGYDKGLEIGSKNGYQNGYNAGKTAGIQQANDYTFIGLLGAVIDAPIQAATGLLNFDLLGFNLADFCFALLTLALILTVVRLFFKGG